MTSRRDVAEIRNGEIYDAVDLLDSETMIGVHYRSGEWYVYPKLLFQVVSQYESIDKSMADIYTGINS